MHYLYNTTSGRIVWSGSGPYLVDGQPGPLPPHIVEIVDAEDPKPDVPAGKALVPSTTIDTEGKLRRTTWNLEDAPLVSVTKYQLKNRITAEEYSAIRAAIAEDPDRQDDWEITTEIDPANPKTIAMMQALTAAGVLTTPVHQIFRAA